MRTLNRASVVLVLCALLGALGSGCFGYNASARRWAYVGDTVLVLGGGAAIATDLLGADEPCMATPARPCNYDAPVSGMLVTGVMLVAGGLIGYVLNATRPTVKTSR